MDSVTYQVGSGCLAVCGVEPTTIDFADAFFARCEHGDGDHHLLARIVVCDPRSEPPVDGGPVTLHDSTLVRRIGDEYFICGSSPGRGPDLDDVASVLRKLARELWLTRRTTATYYVHASAVDNGEHLVVFVGDKRAGKTTLMLDSVMHHGYSLLTNDGLMLCLVDGDITLAPFPTLAKIRRDTAQRSRSWLEAAASKDPFNAAQYRAWAAIADEGGDDNATSLYLTFGALGRPFSEVRLADRVVTFVDVRFADDGVTTLRRHGVDPSSTLRLLDGNRKRMVPQFAETVGLPPAAQSEATEMVGRMVGQAEYAKFIHCGQAAPLLDTIAAGAQVRPGGALGSGTSSGGRAGGPGASRQAELDQRAATAAAVDLARRLGARVDTATVLRNGSNVSILLEPQMLVAKVSRTRKRIRRTEAWFERELAITRYLQPLSVRAIAPSGAVPPGPHWHREHLLAFWDWVDVSPEPVGPDDAGRALQDCHRALTGYTPAGEAYDPFAECDEVLAVTPAAQFLVGERELLASMAAPCFDAARRWAGPVQALHGDPTPENLLRSGDGFVWCDFEDTYAGSVWWDLACLLAPATVADDGDFCERAVDGYGSSMDEPTVAGFIAARVMHSAIWSAYINSPGPSMTRLRRLAWLERKRVRW